MPHCVIDLPRADVIGEPIITDSGNYLCFLLQKPEILATASVTSFNNTDDVKRTIDLYAYSIKKPNGLQLLSVDLSMECGAGDETTTAAAATTTILIDIQPLQENKVLLMTGLAGKGYFTHNADGSLFCGDITPVSCLVYSVISQSTLRRYDTEAHHLSMRTTIASKRHSRMIDGEGRIFDTDDSRATLNKLDMSNVAKNGVVLLLDGKYAAVLLSNRAEIVVVTTADGKTKCHVYVHGLALHISTVLDERTIAVACKDGRLLLFTVVLDLSDPFEEVIRFLPSRQHSNKPPLDPVTALANKVKSIGRFSRSGAVTSSVSPRRDTAGEANLSVFRLTNPDNKLNQLPCIEELAPLQVSGSAVAISAVKPTFNDKKRESNITRSKIEEQKRKFPSLRSVGRAVTLTQTTSSRACVLQ